MKQQLAPTNTLFQQHNRTLSLESCAMFTLDIKLTIIRVKTYPRVDAASNHQLQKAGVRLKICMKGSKKQARTFLTNAGLKKMAARTNITRPDTNEPNTKRTRDREKAVINILKKLKN